jgi:hypothetical protein
MVIPLRSYLVARAMMREQRANVIKGRSVMRWVELNYCAYTYTRQHIIVLYTTVQVETSP